MSYLGLDIGTSGCKAVVFDAGGRQLGATRREYALRAPQPGQAELDPGEVIEACRAVVAEVASLAAASDPVVAMGISSQGEAFTPVGHDGAHLGNAMVSSDSRSLPVIAPFVKAFGLDRLYGITGHTPSTLFSLFKLLWLKAHQPDVWKRAARFLCFEDLVHHHLGLEPAMGWPLAGRTMLFDVGRHAWSVEILEALELDAGRLARPLPSGRIAGTVSPGHAAAWGLPKGVRVVTGGHDQTLAALGAGVVEEGAAMYAAGSVECVCPVLPGLTLNAELCRDNLCCYDYSIEGLYTSVAYSLTGSNLLDYFRDQFGGGASYEQLLSELPVGPTALMTLPYFTPSGTPYFDPHTPGAVLGWRLGTTRGELLKGLLEGVALEMKLNLDLLDRSSIRTDRLIATGGGVRDRRLVQLKADVLNRPIERIDVDEAGCLGAARLAQSAVEGTPVQALVQRDAESASVVLPDPARAERYDRKFESYKAFYTGVKTWHTRRSEGDEYSIAQGRGCNAD